MSKLTTLRSEKSVACSWWIELFFNSKGILSIFQNQKRKLSSLATSYSGYNPSYRAKGDKFDL